MLVLDLCQLRPQLLHCCACSSTRDIVSPRPSSRPRCDCLSPTFLPALRLLVPHLPTRPATACPPPSYPPCQTAALVGRPHRRLMLARPWRRQAVGRYLRRPFPLESCSTPRPWARWWIRRVSVGIGRNGGPSRGHPGAGPAPGPPPTPPHPAQPPSLANLTVTVLPEDFGLARAAWRSVHLPTSTVPVQVGANEVTEEWPWLSPWGKQKSATPLQPPPRGSRRLGRPARLWAPAGSKLNDRKKQTRLAASLQPGPLSAVLAPAGA